MKFIHAFLLVFALILSSAGVAQAQSGDADMEVRAREIGRSLRCVVCQNQSIEDSDAVLAEDMRTLVRSLLKKGDSDQEVIDFMQNRYGDFVLLKPPVQSNTYVLWYAPAVLLLVFLGWFIIRGRRKVTAHQVEIPPLSDEEKQRLERLLEPEE